MDLRKLKTLIDLVAESDIAELEVTEGESKVRIVKSSAMPQGQMVMMPSAGVQQFSAPAAPAAAPAPAAPALVPALAGCRRVLARSNRMAASRRLLQSRRSLLGRLVPAESHRRPRRTSETATAASAAKPPPTVRPLPGGPAKRWTLQQKAAAFG